MLTTAKNPENPISNSKPGRTLPCSRGSTQEALAGFVGFFLNTCLDQVTFTEQLVQPTTFVGHVIRWAEEEEKVAAGRLAA
jgi:hypothetical protein